MGELSALPNIGKTVEKQLNEVGVKKTMLSDEVKMDLKSFYQQHKIK